MPKTKKPARVSYREKVRLRLIELRTEKGWTMSDLQKALADAGYNVGLSTVYAWHKPKEEKGCELPTDLYPAIATIYGRTTPAGWLPQ